jgi:Aspartyl/Asparaginyl beta-hydroxylase
VLDLPDQPLIDKARLVGECVRLRTRIDPLLLKQEVDALPATLWGGTAGRVGVHQNAEALFVRGYAPAEGELPIEDRPVLERLPYLRSLIRTVIGATPLRCLLARLPAATSIPLHVDRPPYFGKSLRLHLPVETNPAVFMLSGRSAYSMSPGEIWVLNNSAMHGVINAHADHARTHVICDFLPSAALLESLRVGERGLGIDEAELARRMGQLRPAPVVS